MCLTFKKWVFNVRNDFSFSKFSGILMRKEQQQPPLVTQFYQDFVRTRLKDKSLKVTKFGDHRPRGFKMAAVKLVKRA